MRSTCERMARLITSLLYSISPSYSLLYGTLYYLPSPCFVPSPSLPLSLPPSLPSSLPPTANSLIINQTRVAGSEELQWTVEGIATIETGSVAINAYLFDCITPNTDGSQLVWCRSGREPGSITFQEQQLTQEVNGYNGLRMSIRGDDLEDDAILDKLDVYVCVDVPVNMSKDNFCANYNRSIGVEGASIAVLNITNGRTGCM